MNDITAHSANSAAQTTLYRPPDIPSKWDIIPIHQSDRGNFKRCRRYWDWNSPSRHNLTLRADVHGVNIPMWFGTGIHYALENYYVPHNQIARDPVESWKTWFDIQWRGGTVAEDWLDKVYDLKPIKAFDTGYGNPSMLQTPWVPTDREPVVPALYQVRGLEDIIPDPDHEAFDELLDLGIKMMEYYKTYAAKYDDFTVIMPEHVFSVPVWDYENNSILKQIDRREQSPNFGKRLEVHARGRIDAITADNNTGVLGIIDHKAQPLNEPILTPKGWKTMGEIKVGEEVIGADGHPTKVTGVFPQGKLDAFRVIFQDRSYTDCSEDHLWTVFSNDNESYKIPRTMNLKKVSSYDKVRWSVPIVAPVEFKTGVDLPVDPYTLGALLGDGYLGGNSVIISCTEQEIIDNISNKLPDELEIYKAHDNNNDWCIAPKKKKYELDSGDTITLLRAQTKNPVLQYLKSIGLMGTSSRTKFVPQDYLFASSSDRLALLQGLLDTDGNCYNGHVSYRTTSPYLRDAVIHLVRSLGGSAKWDEFCKTYKVHIRLTLPPFSLKRKLDNWIAKSNRNSITRYIKKVEKLENQVEMQCISVENKDGLYVTRDFIVTHNTAEKVGEEYFRKLEGDEQCTTYLWALEVEAQYYLGQKLRINEVVYNTLRKTYPKPPTEIKGGWFSVDRANESTTPELLTRFMRERGLDLIPLDEKRKAYVEYVNTVGEEQFIIRKHVTRNRHQLHNAGLRLFLETLDMLSNPRIYPNITNDFRCLNCQFRAPCMAKEDGSDWQELITQNYTTAKDR